MAFVRCSKRRGGTPTGERAAISARRAEARIVDYASVGVSPPFFLSCFFLVSFLALRARMGMKGRTPPPASLNDRSKADVSCRLPHTSDADRIARTMALGLLLARTAAHVRVA